MASSTGGARTRAGVSALVGLLTTISGVLAQEPRSAVDAASAQALVD